MTYISLWAKNSRINLEPTWIALKENISRMKLNREEIPWKSLRGEFRFRIHGYLVITWFLVITFFTTKFRGEFEGFRFIIWHKWGLDGNQSKLIQGERNWGKAKIRLPLNQLWKFKFKLRHWWINPSNHIVWRKSLVIYTNTCWNRAGRASPWSWIRTSNARVKLSWNREHKCICANLFLKMYLCKFIFESVFVKMYLCKFIFENVFVKMYLS